MGGAYMAILLVKVIVTWSAVAIVTGFSLGAAIRRGDRLRKDAFLSCVFAYLELMHASRVR
jgi:hypothetical protein